MSWKQESKDSHADIADVEPPRFLDSLHPATNLLHSHGDYQGGQVYTQFVSVKGPRKWTEVYKKCGVHFTAKMIVVEASRMLLSKWS